MEVEVEEHLAAPASCGKMVSRRQGTAETQLTPDQNENNHKAMSHKNVFWRQDDFYTIFWFIFKREKGLSDIVQHKEQQYSNKYTTRQ